MTWANLTGIMEQDSEIKQTMRRRLRGTLEDSTSRNIEIEDRESSMMAEQRRTLSDYDHPIFTLDEFNGQARAVNANNFDLACPIVMIQNLVKFEGLTNEDPNQYFS